MKILHLISGGDSGGAKTALFSLFSAPRDSVYVTVCCLTDGVFYRGLADTGVDRVLLRQRNRFDLSVAKDIAEMIRRDGFDLLHAHGARANFVAAFVRGRIPVPVVTTVHSDYLRDFDSLTKKLAFTPLNALALRRIPYRIAVSDNFRTMLIRRGFSPNSVFTVYNGFDAQRTSPSLSREKFFEKYGICAPDGAIVFGCAARLDRVKGVDVLLRAVPAVVAAIPSARFIIAGDGGEKHRLMRLAKRLHISENVHFLGHVDDMPSFYDAIDINVIPSRSESFPYSMLEGAAHARPTVAADVGGIPDFIRDGETGLLFPREDHDALARCLLSLTNDPDGAMCLGRAAQKLLLSDFSPKNTADTHKNIYSRILRREQTRAADKKRYDFAVSGYYGYGNVGDEAVLGAIINSVRSLYPDATFAVLSRHPRETRLRFGTDAVFRYGMSVRRALGASRVLLSGGGTLIQDKTSSRSLSYYLSVIKKAKKLGCTVMQYANGFGPIKKQHNLSRAVRIINECVDAVTVRDADALDAMRRAGITVRAKLSADPTLLFPPDASRKSAKRGKYIAVSLRSVKNSPTEAMAVACAADELARRHGAEIVYVAMHPGADTFVSRRAARLFGGEVFVPDTAEDAYAVFADAFLAVTMRLHAAVFAVSAGAPVAAVSYDEKVTGFMRHAGLDTCTDAVSVSPDAVITAAERALSAPSPSPLRRLTELAEVSARDAVDRLYKTKKP